MVNSDKIEKVYITNRELPGTSSTQEGHLEVAIHGPRLPFGSVHCESLTPIFQTDSVYGINSSEALATSGRSIAGAGTGATSGANGMFKCNTGTTSYSFATIQSRRRLRYRPGQGTVGRFSALFSAPVASSIVVAGFGTSESGFYFGYNGTSFGVLHVTGGVRELQTMTITTASTATNDYVVTLPNGTTANVTATNNSSTARTAYEISRGTFPGWDAWSRGSTVLFLSNSAGPVTGTFSLAQTGAGSPAAATVAETTAGVASTDTWVAQSSWNGDKLDGTGYSGITLDPSKGNVFQIGMQYLGFGCVTMSVETVTPDGNNPDFVVAHTFRFPNARTTPHVSNPSFPFTMAAYSAGSTTDVSVSVGSFGGFTEGQKRLTGPRMSYFNTSGVTSSTSAYTPIFTVRNDRVYGGKANQSVVNLLSVGGVAKSTTGITSFFVIRNANLTAGNPNFTSYATTSCTYTDTAATACTFATNDQVVWTGTVAGDGSFVFPFSDDVTLQPGESITIAVRSVTSTATCVGQLNTREDQ